MQILPVFLISMLLPATAHAQSGPTISLGGSTLGATLEAEYRLGPNFGLRGIAGSGSAGFNTDFSGAPATGTLNIGGIGAIADVYFGGGARVSAGGIAPNYGANLAITGDITVNGTPFNNVNISGKIDTLKRFSPVVAIGYSKTFRNNWGISADLGAMYTGGFALTATDNSGQISQVDLDSELAATNTELGQITILPFVKLSVSFAF